jgi:hypothetical protein
MKRYCFLHIVLLLIAIDLQAQTFTRITSNNPIVTDGGPVGYSGAAWVDFDNDGDDDLFVNNDKLYRNDGNGTFVKLATNLGSGQPITDQIIGNANSWADFDNDGDLDVFITSANSFLYRNDGGGNFTQITEGTIGDGFANRGWGCAWADFNNDGNVDIAITHPGGFIPPTNMPLSNHLLMNDGPPNYTFTRITAGPIVTGLAAYTVGTWSDFDQDGDMDYFIGAGPANGILAVDFLYRNLLVENGTATFERMAKSPITTDLQDGQVWNWIDYDNDGDFDAYLTNWGGTFGGLANRLYRNDGGEYTRITTGEIVTDVDVSLSSVWGDFDNDGDLDCFVANDGNPPSGQADRYYRNNGDGTFTKVTGIAVAVFLARRGATSGDYDNDGDLDLLAVGPGTALGLYRNDTQNGNHWIGVTCVGTVSNRAGIGTKVRAKATINGNPVWQLREVSAQNTFNGHNSLRVHFGFGNTTTIDSLKFEWPSGEVDALVNVAADQFLTMTEGSSPTSVEDAVAGIDGFALHPNYPNPFNPSTTITYTIPKDDHVRLGIYNIRGELIRNLVGSFQPAGDFSVVWDGRNDRGQVAASGIYLIRIEAGAFRQMRKMMLIK